MKLSKFIIGFAVLILIITPIIIASHYGVLPTITEFWMQYTTLLLSTTSFLAVIYTISQQNESNKKHDEEIAKEFEFAKQNYEAQILNIVERFGTDDMIRCRQSSDLLFASLSSSDDLKILKTIIKCEAYGYLGVEEDLKSVVTTDVYKHYADFQQITRLFYVLSCYNYDEVTRRAVKYEYDYYRRIFIAINRICRQTVMELEVDKIYDCNILFKTQWLSILEAFDDVFSGEDANCQRYDKRQYQYDF